MIVSEDSNCADYDRAPIFDEEIVIKEDNQNLEKGVLENMEVSIHAMEGQPNPQILMFDEHVGRRTFAILIDGGSTHNFLDPKATKFLGSDLEPTSPMNVIVANGEKLTSTY